MVLQINIFIYRSNIKIKENCYDKNEKSCIIFTHCYGHAIDCICPYGVYDKCICIRNIQVNIDYNYNFNLTGLNGHTAGGIVCYNEDTGEIEDCSVTMLRGSNLGFTSIVGGIVGINNGTIRDCWATADVTTCGTFGVIAGINYGTITGSCGMGNIVQQVDTYEGCYELSQVGGIAGINGTDGKISNCVGGTWDDSYLRVVIDVEYVDDEDLAPYSGPIAGENNGEISNCSNYGYTIDTGNLHSWWAWFHTYDQLKNINNTI